MSFSYATSFADALTMSGTTAASGFPATNAGDRDLPFWPWRSTATGSDQELIFDCGSVQTLVGLVLYDVNVASLKIALSTDAVTYSTAIPGYTTSTLFTPSLDEEDGRYKLVLTFTSQSVRAVKVTFPASTARTDSAAYFRLGTLFWITAYTTLTKDPIFGMTANWDGNEMQQELDNGRLEVLSRGESFVRFGLRNDLLTSTARTEWNAVKIASRAGTPFLWMFNLQSLGQDCYWCVRTGEVNVAKNGNTDEHQINWRQIV